MNFRNFRVVSDREKWKCDYVEKIENQPKIRFIQQIKFNSIREGNENSLS